MSGSNKINYYQVVVYSVHREKASFLWWELLRDENLSNTFGRKTDKIGFCGQA